MNENLCLPDGWKRADAFDDARRALLREAAGLKNASAIVKVWTWIAERKTLKSSFRQWNLPRQILADFSRTLGLTENQIRGALRWLVDHDWLGRDGKRDPATGRWKCLRILNPRKGHVTCVPIRYHLGSKFLNFFPKALFSFFRNQYVATLQGSKTGATASGETKSGCKKSWFSPQVEEVRTEAQQAAENEAGHAMLADTIAVSVEALEVKAAGFVPDQHPAENLPAVDEPRCRSHRAPEFEPSPWDTFEPQSLTEALKLLQASIERLNTFHSTITRRPSPAFRRAQEAVEKAEGWVALFEAVRMPIKPLSAEAIRSSMRLAPFRR